ncbi:GGDEF domain-containing protein [Roseateles koreensis]|uniref:diguanylate cyclase n=1 Tax=Roseateles koreensis TaxID=2987526 RepID=A0ABT5KT09_9BURK|nr:GGDEF domain-containing protein [Roseateles koreensis]MDC8786049.1 GGDEF domain-containing protein [Roseateles koreensis]
MPKLVAEKIELSGLLDRSALQGLLDQAAAQAIAQSQALAVLTLDVDHFKDYQDDQGLAQAEAALLSLAKFLQTQLPAGASLAHLGADSFVAVLPGQDITAALASAESLREAVALELSSLASPTPLTISLGVAASPTGGNWSARGLLSLADTRMTFAKKRLLPHHNHSWAGNLPSDWYARMDIEPGFWPSV